jgi:hypothetical protein
LRLVLGWGVIAIAASTLIEEYVPYRLHYFGRLVLLLYSVAYFRRTKIHRWNSSAGGIIGHRIVPCRLLLDFE